tara:strand:+ start:329 stop:697 length:369 start_codon:yes stop_codon:yes gene_type:complete
MADCAQAIQSIGSYEFVISGDVKTEADFNANVKWVSGADSNDTAIFGSKPDAVTWTKVKADMDKQDAFVNQKAINATAQAYLTSTDWYSIRAAEGGTAMPADVKTKRAEERAKIVSYANFSG